MTGLILDENLPTNLAFKPSLPVVHCSSLGKRVTDEAIWNHAHKHELVIVSKDADFSARIMASQPPPWVVHLRFGNIRLSEYHALLASVWPKVESLLLENKLICVYQNRIEAFGD